MIYGATTEQFLALNMVYGSPGAASLNFSFGAATEFTMLFTFQLPTQVPGQTFSLISLRSMGTTMLTLGAQTRDAMSANCCAPLRSTDSSAIRVCARSHVLRHGRHLP